MNFCGFVPGFFSEAIELNRTRGAEILWVGGTLSIFLASRYNRSSQQKFLCFFGHARLHAARGSNSVGEWRLELCFCLFVCFLSNFFGEL